MPIKLNHKNGMLRVCVDGAADGHISGRVVGERLTGAIPFTDMGSLLLQVERVLERQNFPQAFQRIRSFQNAPVTYPDPVLPEGAMSAEEVHAAKGQEATFQLMILTRKNATWQGSVDWLDGTEAESFASDLEFLSMVEERFR